MGNLCCVEHEPAGRPAAQSTQQPAQLDVQITDYQPALPAVRKPAQPAVQSTHKQAQTAGTPG